MTDTDTGKRIPSPPSISSSDSGHAYDVIVVGAGPTGLAAANILVQAGHTVAIFERHATLYNLPRAGHIDNEILRILQGIDCLEAVLEDFFPFLQVPLLGVDGQVLVDLTHTQKSPSSFHGGSAYQPVLEDALYTQLKRHDQLATIYQGWTVEGARQDNTSVHIRARPTEGPTDDRKAEEHGATIFECRYLIAADGADSSIRRGLEIEREDFGPSERWLDVDVAYRRPCNFGPPAIVGDPKRPHLIMPLGRRHHRFEWQLLPHESAAEFSAPEKAWKLLAEKGVRADDVEIVRQAVYTFEYRLSQRWREGRIFLMGDAAHTMPPCLGQGMCSGIRDAANLGWKLDLVLRRLASDSMLESYETERRPHVKAWSDLSLKAGEILCLTDPAKAAARDARFRSGNLPPWRPSPMLTTGLLDISSSSSASVAGQLFPQRAVRRGERIGLFDDVAGPGFLLVSRADPRPFMGRAGQLFGERMRMDCVWFSPDANDASALVDETGEYRTFFEESGLAALIVRPDRYVFGGAQRLDETGGLIDKLQCMLNVSSAELTNQAR
jgi:3-(3-hydroxy-phenyl)propionate hydroxylase